MRIEESLHETGSTSFSRLCMPTVPHDARLTVKALNEAGKAESATQIRVVPIALAGAPAAAGPHFTQQLQSVSVKVSRRVYYMLEVERTLQ